MCNCEKSNGTCGNCTCDGSCDCGNSCECGACKTAKDEETASEPSEQE